MATHHVILSRTFLSRVALCEQTLVDISSLWWPT